MKTLLYFTLLHLLISVSICMLDQTKLLFREHIRLSFTEIIIEGKSVAVVANQTSMVGQTHLVDNLLSIGINIKVIFSPEHGFRNLADAGETIENGKDPETGIPLISLYG